MQMEKIQFFEPFNVGVDGFEALAINLELIINNQ
jgi:hypothetical protein